jgi:hypothetical protein
MPNAMAVQVTFYIHKGDQRDSRPPHREILHSLRQDDVYAATELPGAADSPDRQKVYTAHVADADGKLSFMIDFIDADGCPSWVLRELKQMPARWLMVQGSVD